MIVQWPFRHDHLWSRHPLQGSCDRLDPDLRVRRFTVALPGLSPRPFSLAFFSDLHWDGQPAARLRGLVDTINAAAVDVVIFGGDLAAHLVHVPDALRQLAALRARRACLAVRGNRESACTWLDAAFWRSRYRQAGFQYLENEPWPATDTPGAPAIVGLDDYRHGTPDFTVAARAAAAGHAVITVTHNPDAVGCQPEAFLGHLVLSGHTHGGQYRLPAVGALFTSSRFWRQFDHGWRRHRNGALLYITSGVGETGYRLLRRRVFCPPELLLLTVVARDRSRGDAKDGPWIASQPHA